MPYIFNIKIHSFSEIGNTLTVTVFKREVGLDLGLSYLSGDFYGFLRSLGGDTRSFKSLSYHHNANNGCNRSDGANDYSKSSPFNDLPLRI